jgi:hypothetical protein
MEFDELSNRVIGYNSVLYNAELAKKRSDILARMRLKPGEYAPATSGGHFQGMETMR